MKKYSLIIFVSLFISRVSLCQIIYNDITPDIEINGDFPNGSVDYSIDIDIDGTIDYIFTANQSYLEYSNQIKPQNGNEIIYNNSFADTLNLDDSITYNHNWTPQIKLSSNGAYGLTGSGCFYNTSNKYIGIRLKKGNSFLYGWIRMKDEFTIADYAYNSNLNTPISAGWGMPFVAYDLKLLDVDNYGDGRDLKITFKKALNEKLVSCYKLLIVPNNIVQSFSLNLAKNISDSLSLLVTPQNKNIDTVFFHNTKDVTGALLKSLQNYTVFALSIPNQQFISDTLLSNASNSIKLTTPNLPAQQVIINTTKIPGSSYLVSLSFDSPITETGISEYRLIIVPNKSPFTFNVDSALQVSSSNYFRIQPTNNDNYLITSMSDTLKTYNGYPLQLQKHYRALILSVADSLNANVATLSTPSNLFQVYTQVPSVSEIKIIDQGETNSSSDLRLLFNKINDESLIAEYRCLLIPSDQATNFNLDSAVKTTHFYAISPQGYNIDTQLPNNLKDVFGNYIIDDVSYELFVLTVSDSLQTDVNALSIPSSRFALHNPSFLFSGQETGGVIFTDIVDTTLIAWPYGAQPNFLVDVDNNGINDIEFLCSASGSATGSKWYSVNVSTLNNTQIHFINDSSNWIARLDSLDMIYFDLNWKSTNGVLTYSSFITPPIEDNYLGGVWLDSTGYMALRLFNNLDTIYAWIKMFVFNSGLKLYGFTIMHGVYDLVSEVNREPILKIFPNPASNMIKLYISKDSFKKSSDIIIKNEYGQTVLNQVLTNSYTEVDISNLLSGVYFIEYITSYSVEQKKIIVVK